MSRFFAADSGGTVRLIKNTRVFAVDSGATTRAIKRGFVIDSGGVARQFLQSRNPEAGSVTAGTNGTAYGYRRSNYGSASGFPGAADLLSDNVRMTQCIDVGTSGSNFQLILDGTAAGFLPPATYFTSIVAHGQTRLASAASYSSASLAAIYTWSAGQVGWWLDPGTPYTVTINF
jgi:hypothetical protein